MNVVPISIKNGRVTKQSPEIERNIFARKLQSAITRECGSFNVNMFLRSIVCLPVLLLPLIMAHAAGMSTDLFLSFVLLIVLSFHSSLLVAVYADTIFCRRAHYAVVRENRELMSGIKASRSELWRQVDEERQGEVKLNIAA